MRNVYFIFFCSFLFFCFDAHKNHVRADTADTFVQVQCIKDLNILKINVFDGMTEVGYGDYGEKQKEIWKSYGIRNYLSMVSVTRLLNGDGTPSKNSRDDRMIAINPVQTLCRLTEKQHDGRKLARTYSVHIEPHFFNTNPNGECGGAQTFSLTIKQADQVLIDNLPFWYRCRINPWISDRGVKGRKNEGIDSIAFHPGDSRFTFSGSYLDTDDYICDGVKNTCDQNKYIYVKASKVFGLDKDIPITAEKLYITDPLQANYE